MIRLGAVLKKNQESQSPSALYGMRKSGKKLLTGKALDLFQNLVKVGTALNAFFLVIL